MTRDGKVVVVVSPEYLYNDEEGIYAAQMQDLGITGYGRTEEEAGEKIKRMFAAMVNAHRDLGSLDKWLGESGVEWHWYDEYEGDTPVEDVSLPMPTRTPVSWSPSPTSGPSRTIAPAA